jgi:hypothetical protein
MARLRLCEPVPHDWVQVDQLSAKTSYTQSMAHACVLQSRVSAECAQATPPFCGGSLVRLRFCEPVPHVMVHVDQTLKVPSLQLIGHEWTLQVRVSAECGQTLPPFAGAIVTRLRLWTPAAPHDVVHVDHVSVKAAKLQSMAHASLLQLRVSAECGQAAPPKLGCVKVRLRDCEPVPHDLVHVDQALKLNTKQSMAHS